MKNLIAAVLASAFALGAGANTTAPSMAASASMVKKDIMKSDMAQPMVKKATRKNVKKPKAVKPAA
jgi:hypothetical protein